VLALLRSRLLVDFMVVVRRPVFGPGRIPSPLQRVARPSLVVFGRRRWRRSHGSSWFVISRSRVSPPARIFFLVPGPRRPVRVWRYRSPARFTHRRFSVSVSRQELRARVPELFPVVACGAPSLALIFPPLPR
jgi:hypothetical protein